MLEVLGGRTAAEVGRHRQVDAAVLRRWVRAFVEAGTAQVTNQPDAEAAHQRDRFLSAFAHEIRSPLTVAQGWAAMLLDDDVPREDLVDSVRHLDEALSRLAERTRDIELLTAASLGRLRLRPYRLPVRDLVAGIPGIPCPLAVGGEGPDTEVHVDPDLFGPVLRDLWSAAHLQPAPRAVRLEVVSGDPWVEIRVVRDAEPIGHAVLQALFEPFESSDDTTCVTIGLYLARALTVAHGGTLGVDQDDDGAVFWVRVPHQPTTARSST